MHLIGIGIADVGWIVLHAEKIIDGISRYYVHQYWRTKKKQEADQELVVGSPLGKYLDVRSDAQMVRLRHGKPMLKSGKNYFNLSYGGDYVVLASADTDISVDIERIKDVHWPIVWKVFTLGQREQLEQAMETKRSELFTKCWAECEAVLKLRGTGFAADTAMANARSRSAESEDRRRHLHVHLFRYKEYMIAYAAHGGFNVSVEEDRSYLYT